jgi:hypothetical protein
MRCCTGQAVASPGPAGGLAPYHHGGGEHARPQGRPGHPPGQPRPLPLLARHLGHPGPPNSSCLDPRLPPLRPTEPGRLGCWPASGPQQPCPHDPANLPDRDQQRHRRQQPPAPLRYVGVPSASRVGRARTPDDRGPWGHHLAALAEVTGSTDVHARVVTWVQPWRLLRVVPDRLPWLRCCAELCRPVRFVAPLGGLSTHR